ncbi:gp436 family protein [Acinetobacter venetianus]|uniref:gp436 family protein n=1 Tax=Acinetobacter venetianus TaxID=52133 RepID=UPI003A8EF9C0
MYATRDDLIVRFGESEIANLEAMQTQPDAVNEALQDATEEIDGYVAVKYALPLPSIPTTLKRVACNIARYRLYFQRPTEEVEKRYESELEYLKSLAAGKAVLNIQNEQNEVVEEKPRRNPKSIPIGTSYTGGVFSDEQLNKMPSV